VKRAIGTPDRWSMILLRTSCAECPGELPTGRSSTDRAAIDAYSSAVTVPAIRYVHTTEGVSLAYTVLGDGPPLLYAFAGPALSNLEHEWIHPGLVEQYEAMAEQRTVVRFDWRNCGLSTRHVDDVSPGAHLRDLLALQDHLGFEQVALRVHGSASIALRYAATHPDRVSSLILSSPSVVVASPDQAPGRRRGLSACNRIEA
jgi:pimeloyl-ACP methyl ester carboxylesterase